MLEINNIKVYDLIPSVLASGYAMRTDPLEKPLDSYTEDSEEFKQGLVRANKRMLAQLIFNKQDYIDINDIQIY